MYKILLVYIFLAWEAIARFQDELSAIIGWLLTAVDNMIAAASIWFEIWVIVDPGKQKFRFFQANFRKKSIFSGNLKKLDFQAKIGHSGQIILFLFKIHHSRTYFLYLIRCDNISRPVHDPHNHRCGSLTTPAQNLGGLDPQPLQDWRPWMIKQHKPHAEPTLSRTPSTRHSK